MMTIDHDKGNPAAKQGDNAVSLLELVMLAKRPGRLSGCRRRSEWFQLPLQILMTPNVTNCISQHRRCLFAL